MTARGQIRRTAAVVGKRTFFQAFGEGPGALEQVRTRLRASRETERAALLEVVPDMLRTDSKLALIDFHQLGN